MSLEDELCKREHAYGLLKKEMERVKRQWSTDADRCVKAQMENARIATRLTALIKLTRQLCLWTLREEIPPIKHAMEECSRFLEAVDGPVEWYT